MVPKFCFSCHIGHYFHKMSMPSFCHSTVILLYENDDVFNICSRKNVDVELFSHVLIDLAFHSIKGGGGTHATTQNFFIISFISKKFCGLICVFCF
jgi:hypothetical protein